MLWPSFARQIFTTALCQQTECFFDVFIKRAGVIIFARPPGSEAFTLTASLRADGRKR